VRQRHCGVCGKGSAVCGAKPDEGAEGSVSHLGAKSAACAQGAREDTHAHVVATHTAAFKGGKAGV